MQKKNLSVLVNCTFFKTNWIQTEETCNYTDRTTNFFLVISKSEQNHDFLIFKRCLHLAAQFRIILTLTMLNLQKIRHQFLVHGKLVKNLEIESQARLEYIDRFQKLWWAPIRLSKWQFFRNTTFQVSKICFFRLTLKYSHLTTHNAALQSRLF